MRKGWIITKKYLESRNEETFIEVSIIGPSLTTLTKEQIVLGHPFKMFDDDDVLCYEGYLYADKNSEDGFMPLDNYGMPDAGCTYVQYKNEIGEWKTL